MKWKRPSGTVETGRMKVILIHLVSDYALMTQLPISTKMIRIPPVLPQLKAAGRTVTDEFLRAQKDDLGHLQTAYLQAMFG